MPSTTLDEATAEALQGIVDSMVAAGAPDAIAAVITAEGSWSGAAGIAGPNGRQATVEDMFSLASVSKTFVTALVLRLAELGMMDLDASLAEYLGGLDVDANGATVRQALAQRAGLSDTSGPLNDACASDPTRIWTIAEVLDAIEPPVAEPGVSTIPSNPTYKLLRLAAEQAARGSFAEVLRNELLNPVGAERIVVQVSDVATPKPWALPLEGHTGGVDVSIFGQGETLPCVADSTFSTGNAIAADAPTLAAWAWHLFAGDVISGDSLALMESGVGLDRYSSDPATYGHEGTKPGYASVFSVTPELQTVVVVFVNDPNADVAAAASRFLAAAHDS